MAAAHKKLEIYAAFIIGALIQIKATLFATSEYSGLRLSTADLLLPFAGLGILYTLLSKRSHWPSWADRTTTLWSIAIALVMSIALLNGYLYNHALSQWALVNKYCGFLVLLSYFYCGGWIITNTKKPHIIIQSLIEGYYSFFIALLALSALSYSVKNIMPATLWDSLWFARYPWEGLTGNRNQFGLSAILCACLILWGQSYTNRPDKAILSLKTKHALRNMLWFLLPAFFAFNGSRAGWIILGGLSLVYIFTNPLKKIWKPIILLLAGTGCIFIISFTTGEALTAQRQLKHLENIAAGDLHSYHGDNYRFIAVEDGLDLYKQSSPLFGAGLGAYETFQKEKRGKFVDIIDFTALWLLVETGLIGLIAFIGFYASTLYALYKKAYQSSSATALYSKALFIFMICFALMSSVHEVMYARSLWFMLGLGLAMPLKHNQN